MPVSSNAAAKGNVSTTAWFPKQPPRTLGRRRKYHAQNTPARARNVRLHLVLGLIVGTWYVFNGFQPSTSQGLLTLLIAVVGYFLWILYVRVALEFLVAMFRTAENIARASGR